MQLNPFNRKHQSLLDSYISCGIYTKIYIAASESSGQAAYVRTTDCQFFEDIVCRLKKASLQSGIYLGSFRHHKRDYQRFLGRQSMWLFHSRFRNVCPDNFNLINRFESLAWLETLCKMCLKKLPLPPKKNEGKKKSCSWIPQMTVSLMIHTNTASHLKRNVNLQMGFN